MGFEFLLLLGRALFFMVFLRVISIISLVFVCASSLAANQDSSGCEKALSSWQSFLQTQLNINFAMNVALSDRDAMKALVNRGFVEAGSIHQERQENQGSPSGFLYEVDGFTARLLLVDLQQPIDPQGFRRIYIHFGDNLYSARVLMSHPSLVAFREFAQGLVENHVLNLARAQQLLQPAFRSSGAVAIEGRSAAPKQTAPQPVNSGLDAVLRQQIEHLMEHSTKDAQGLDLDKLLTFAVDPRIFEYQHFEAGRFVMGSPDSEVDRWSNEGPQRVVELSSFEMGNHIPQWALVIWRLSTQKLREGSKLLLPCFRTKGYGDGDFLDLGKKITLNGNHPAERLSYNEALEFVDWLNNLDLVKKSGCRYNLPSQAQWQYAVRYLGPKNISEDPRPFAEAQLGDYAFFETNSGDRTHAIGQKRPHPNGLLDLLGNAWVWTLDGWTNDLDGIPHEIDPVVLQGPSRVIVGGGFRNDVSFLRSAARHKVSQSLPNNDVGIRLVRHCR